MDTLSQDTIYIVFDFLPIELVMQLSHEYYSRYIKRLSSVQLARAFTGMFCTRQYRMHYELFDVMINKYGIDTILCFVSMIEENHNYIRNYVNYMLQCAPIDCKISGKYMFFSNLVQVRDILAEFIDCEFYHAIPYAIKNSDLRLFRKCLTNLSKNELEIVRSQIMNSDYVNHRLLFLMVMDGVF